MKILSTFLKKFLSFFSKGNKSHESAYRFANHEYEDFKDPTNVIL